MADVFLLSQAQMCRIKPFFPLSRGMPRVDDRRASSIGGSCSSGAESSIERGWLRAGALVRALNHRLMQTG